MRKYQWGEDADVSGPRNYFRESIICDLLGKYIKKGKILDAGCGTGSLAIRLAIRGYNLIALDSSTLSLSALNEKVKKQKLQKKIKCVKGSILKLPFNENTFQGIVCGEVLEHIENDKKAIRELHRVLKKKGVCVITSPAHPENWDISDDISDHKRRYTKKELMKKFKNAGFTIVDCFYMGFPLNNLWHTNIFVPFLQSKMMHKKDTVSLLSRIKKNLLIQKIVSYVFYIDFLFAFFNKGNIIVLVAKKI